MTIPHRLLIPLPGSNVTEHRANLVIYWTAVASCDDLGGALGTLVHDTEVRVTELLQSGDERDVYEACKITAKFEYLRQIHT